MSVSIQVNVLGMVINRAPESGRDCVCVCVASRWSVSWSALSWAEAPDDRLN